MATSSSTSSTHSLNMRTGLLQVLGELAGYLQARGIRVAGGHSVQAARQPSQNFRYVKSAYRSESPRSAPSSPRPVRSPRRPSPRTGL